MGALYRPEDSGRHSVVGRGGLRLHSALLGVICCWCSTLQAENRITQPVRDFSVRLLFVFVPENFFFFFSKNKKISARSAIGGLRNRICRQYASFMHVRA